MRFPKRKTLLLAIRESWKLAWVYGIHLESGENREENGYLKLEIGNCFRIWKKLEIALAIRDGRLNWGTSQWERVKGNFK